MYFSTASLTTSLFLMTSSLPLAFSSPAAAPAPDADADAEADAATTTAPTDAWSGSWPGYSGSAGPDG